MTNLAQPKAQSDDFIDAEQANLHRAFLSISRAPRPLVKDPSWTPRHATVAMASDQQEADSVYRLRYRVYVHEQGIPETDVDWERKEMMNALDPWSYLWYAKDGDNVVGTITQTIIDPEFKLSRLPPALEIESFPQAAGPFGYTSRFVIAPEYRGMWVLPGIARHSYAHGRLFGGKFDFIVANPTLVNLYERVGYIRYTQSAVHTKDIGLLIPMVMPATDHDLLRAVRSACLPAAEYFPDEPEWGRWLRDCRPIIDEYYGSASRHRAYGAELKARTGLRYDIAVELSSMSFVHHFPAGTILRQVNDRVTCSFLALDGTLSIDRTAVVAKGRCAPDGVELSSVMIDCVSDASVLCIPDSALGRLKRRYPELSAHLTEWLVHRPSMSNCVTEVVR